LTADALGRSLDLLAGLETLDRLSMLTDVLATGCAAEQPDAPTALARAG
jgi:hypothetical protein